MNPPCRFDHTVHGRKLLSAKNISCLTLTAFKDRPRLKDERFATQRCSKTVIERERLLVE